MAYAAGGGGGEDKNAGDVGDLWGFFVFFAHKEKLPTERSEYSIFMKQPAVKWKPARE